jgi:hypothetical protein
MVKAPGGGPDVAGCGACGMVGAAGAGEGALGKGFEGTCSAPPSPPMEEYAPIPPGVGISQTTRSCQNRLALIHIY